MPRSTAPRAYVSDFKVKLGPFTTNGKLVPIPRTGSNDYNRFKMVCPDCTEPTQVFQQYVCSTNPSHAHSAGDMDRAKDLGDGVLMRVSQEEIAAAKESDLPDNEFHVTVHPVEEVSGSTWDGNNAWVFLPDAETEDYTLLAFLVQNSGKAFVSMCNIRNSEGLFRLDVWHGHLIVQKLFWPEDCNEFTNTTIDCPEAIASKALGFVERLVQPFDPDAYKSGVKERLVALEEAVASGSPVPTRPTVEKKDGWGTLLNALEAFGS
jgi:non-homologous end joining protein Ku